MTLNTGEWLRAPPVFSHDYKATAKTLNTQEIISFSSLNRQNAKIQIISIQHKHERETKQNKKEIERQLVTGISYKVINYKVKTHTHTHTPINYLFRKTLNSDFFY